MGRRALATLLLALTGCSATSRAATVRAIPAVASTTVATTTTAPRASSTTTDPPAPVYARPAAHPEVTDDRVYLLGDSIAESVGPRYSGAVCDALEPLGWNVTVDAFMGRRTSDAVQSLRSHLTSVGQVVVVLIGHNDGIDPTSYRNQLERLLQLVPDVPRIVLLTNYEFERGRDRMNQVLRDLSAIDDHIELVDWNLVVQNVSGAIRGDGVHLTAAGEQALAGTIATALGPAPPHDGSRRTCITFRNTRPSSGRHSGRTSTSSPTTSFPTTAEPPNGSAPASGGSSPSSAPAASTTEAPSPGSPVTAPSPPSTAAAPTASSVSAPGGARRALRTR